MYSIYSKLGVTPALCRKLWLIMRLTTVFLLASLLQVSAATFGQLVTINKRNVPLRTVLRDIRSQTGYDFLFDAGTLTNNVKTSIAVSNVTVDEAVKNALLGLPYTFKIEGNRVSIRKEEPSFLEKVIARVQAIDVSGTVVDESGRPLSGATVRVKPNGIGVITDVTGNFILKNVAEDAVITISYLGYKEKELAAKRDLQTIKMELSNNKLDEVQVLAYGQTSQRLSTGNVSSITAADISKSPVSNPMLALQGRIPGITIVQATGNANSAVGVQIQGRNSIKNGNDPFYVIDGVPYSSQLLGFNMLPYANFNGSPLNFINPNDIESISILKDADATAIYGSRAANGAVVITTKKGRSGRLSATFGARYDIGQMGGKQLQTMNTSQYLQMRREAIKNDGGTVTDADYDINGKNWDTTRYTNWRKELLGGTAINSNYNLALSGGGDNTTFSINATHARSTSIFPVDFSDKNTSLHLSLNSSSADQKLKVQFKGSYTNDRNELPMYDLPGASIALPPNAPAPYNADGSLNWQLDANGRSTWTNPYAQLLSTYLGKTSNLIANSVLSYEPIKGLEIKSSFGYNEIRTDEIGKQSLEFWKPEFRAFLKSSATYANTQSASWTIEPQVNYRKATDIGQFSIQLGGTIMQRTNKGSNFYAKDFLNEETMDDMLTATSYEARGTINSQYKYTGVFAALNYNYADRYLINLTARRDGSSRFGGNNKFHNFGAAGLAWVFSSEPWLKESLGPLSYGKLKVSYGSTGSDQIGDYNYLSLYYPAYTGIAYGGMTNLFSSGPSNPYLQWEETRKLNLGMDLGFFNDRLSLSANYFRNRSSNQLIYTATAAYVGYSTLLQNFPATVQNTGLEFALSSQNIIGKDFQWSTSFNFTVPKNKLVRFDGIENTTYNGSLFIGESVNVSKAYHYAGVNPQTGVYQFYDKNGALTSSPSGLGDDYVHIDLSPRFYGGIENNFSYKGFEFSFLVNFVRQYGSNFGSTALGTIPGLRGYNVATDVLDRWQSPGQQATYQRYSANGSLNDALYYYRTSDAVISNASYVKLKNATLGWQLPEKWRKPLGVNQARVYMQGQNLHTFTLYKGLDPEAFNITTLPPLRVITFGVQATF